MDGDCGRAALKDQLKTQTLYGIPFFSTSGRGKKLAEVEKGIIQPSMNAREKVVFTLNIGPNP
jgi:hypothetical protein